MPIFEYECAKCKKTFEVLVSGSSKKRTKCPFCGSMRVAKLFSSFSTISRGAEGSGGKKASSSCATCASRTCSSCR